MKTLSFLTPIVTLALVAGAFASVGPVANLRIGNAAVSPDGYTRDAVVVNGATPGPLIVGNKVGHFALAYDRSSWC